MMVLCWAIIEKSWTAGWLDDGMVRVVGVSITQMSSVGQGEKNGPPQKNYLKMVLEGHCKFGLADNVCGE